MRGVVVVVAAAAGLALAAATPASAGGPTLEFGAAEDSVKQPTLAAATTEMNLAKLAGLDAVRVTVQWRPGLSAPPEGELDALGNAAQAGKLAGIRVVLSVYPFGSSVTPLTPEARAEFASFAAAVAKAGFAELIIGNEPNINRFWLPQFALDGSNAAAAAFLPLMAESYDAIKAAAPKTVVWGLGLSPRGSDNPALSRHTHSPSAFILDLGAAYRSSGRTTPIMDGLAIHPYGDSSSQAPRDSAHPRSTSIGLADYDKLVGLLGRAFDGTGQRGSTLPILYDEYGVETQIPADKTQLYEGTEPTTTRPVDEATQAAYYRQAAELVYCQPNVRGLFLFHIADEKPRAAWQSGLYAIDGSPRAAVATVRQAVAESRRGILAKCPSLRLTPRVTLKRVADPFAASVELRTDLDAAYVVRLVRTNGIVVGQAKGRTVGGVAKRVRIRLPRNRVGRFRFEVTARTTVNVGAPRIARGRSFQLR